jgi:uncharacterized protein (DUF302 family)
MSATQAPAVAEDVVSKPSNASVARTMDRLEAAVRAKGLAVFARVDHAAGARSVGLTMQDAQVLIFGSPKAGTPLMVARPLVALDLPLRALVWSDPSGQVWVSFNATTYYPRRYGVLDGLEKNLAAIEGLVDAAVSGS